MPVALNMNVRNKISKNLCVSLYEITLPLAPFLYEKHGLRWESKNSAYFKEIHIKSWWDQEIKYFPIWIPVWKSKKIRAYDTL